MEEEPILNMRETSRNQLVLNRRKHRDEVADFTRTVNNLRINPGTVLDISNKLKTKSAIGLAELQTLKNALMDEAAHVEVVLNTQGALRGLVRELTGHDANKQVAAAGCLCNLALGDSRACGAIAKAAGAYLVASLDNLTSELAITSAWTIGNLAGSGRHACEILIAQGTISKLAELVESGIEHIGDAAVYALVHFAYQMGDDLRPEHLQKICRHLPRLNVEVTAQLLFLVSCHKDFSSILIHKEFLQRMLHHIHANLDKPIESVNLSYIFRTFANMNCELVSRHVIDYFLSNNIDGGVRKLVENGNESVLWFLGNAYKACTHKDLLERLLN